ncbi:MAG: hypothetical protein V2I33_26095 [Kangiellaceae bacterium]|jgi:hypothetical protein|nr:hypothetical protein [Kangiellaceae bacterium]
MKSFVEKIKTKFAVIQRQFCAMAGKQRQKDCDHDHAPFTYANDCADWEVVGSGLE